MFFSLLIFIIMHLKVCQISVPKSKKMNLFCKKISLKILFTSTSFSIESLFEQTISTPTQQSSCASIIKLSRWNWNVKESSNSVYRCIPWSIGRRMRERENDLNHFMAFYYNHQYSSYQFMSKFEESPTTKWKSENEFIVFNFSTFPLFMFSTPLPPSSRYTLFQMDMIVCFQYNQTILHHKRLVYIIHVIL